MSPAVEDLVRETIELTGADQPGLLDEDSPVLSDDALAGADRQFYLIGLIGGKDVGKSALVNALAGRDITATSDHGPGTEGVIAYAHSSQEKPLRELLEREVPGQYRIATHDVRGMRRQVLLDLPDIDSHFAGHLEVTRRMLRHMLFPVWMVSVEKYADRQPQQMLARVAEGNAPDNFVFCLNKVDQLGGMKSQDSSSQLEEHGPWVPEPDSAGELRDDYAARVQKTLSLENPPHIFMISATRPQAYELPGLREVLAREKTPDIVRQSQELAARRQDRSLTAWLDRQQLPLRARQLARMQQDAEELTTQRIAGPLLEEVIPRLLADPSTGGAMAEEILNERVAHWPVVRLVHTLLSPVFVLIRGVTARNAAPLQSAQGLVDTIFKETGRSASDLVQTTFAQLRQSQPGLAELYAHNRLWEQMPADATAAELRHLLAATIQRQRDAARQRLVRHVWLGAPFRWLFTIGAVLWFPFIQPVLHAILGGADVHSWKHAAALAVEVLGVNYLLASSGFLILYFVALWLALRWSTQRKVLLHLSSNRIMNAPDHSLNLTTQTLEWIDRLLSPLRQSRQRMDALVGKAEAVGIISDAGSITPKTSTRTATLS